MAQDTRLVSVLTCDDVLANQAGRMTLYSIFRDLYADGYPANVVRLHVVTTWLNESLADGQIVQRVVILMPGEGELLAEATSSFTVQAGMYHTHMNRFRALVFPVPGTYRVQVQEGTRVAADAPLYLKGPEEAEAEPQEEA